jgi:adhesin transport system outer membrane protein
VVLSMRKTALAVTLFAAFGYAHAQQATNGLPGPMVAAARTAVLTNPEVQARWNGFKASESERQYARSGFFPKIDFVGTIGMRNLKTPTANYGTFNFNAAELTLDQMLYDGMFTANESKRLGLAKLTRYYELREIAENITLEAMRAYIDVLRYRELVDAATQNYIEHKRSAQLVQERAKSGVGKGVDVEQANGRLALSEFNLVVELTNLHDVSARYLRVVGEKPPVSLPTLPEPFVLGVMPPTVQVLMDEGLQGSPTLNAAVENTLAYRKGIESRKAFFLPRLDLRLYQSREQAHGGDVSGVTNDKGIQLTLSYNLYRGGADKALERKAVEDAEQAHDLQIKACRDVRQTLSIAYSDVQSIASQQRYQETHRLSTEKSLEAYRQQFDIGQRTLLDMLDSQNEFFEATRSYINSRHNQAIAQARTLAGMGRLVNTMGVSREDIPSAQEAGQERDRIDPSELCPLEDVEVDSLERIKAEAVLPPIARAAVAAPVKSVVTKVRLSADALFDFDKSDLKMEGIDSLSKFSARLKTMQIDKVSAVGHTDSMGSEAYNEKLSQARAEAVKSYLVKQGIDGNKVQASGMGELQPVADNATKEGRAKNRRVDVEVLEAVPAPTK